MTTNSRPTPRILADLACARVAFQAAEPGARYTLRHRTSDTLLSLGACRLAFRLDHPTRRARRISIGLVPELAHLEWMELDE